MPLSNTTAGTILRRSAELGTVHNEDSMYPGIEDALSGILPHGYSAVVRAHDDGPAKPDITVCNGTGAKLLTIEVKLPNTLPDAFTRDPSTGQHQIDRYRLIGLPVLLTDSVRWFDVTLQDVTQYSHPLFDFSSADEVHDRVAETELRNFLSAACDIRPRQSLESATSSIAGVIDRINSMDSGLLTRGWAIVREGLGLIIDDDSLDSGGVGEIVAFTLLGIATQLPDLNDRSFVTDANTEWNTEAATWDSEQLPSMMAATLREFRDEDRRVGILGSFGWVEIRSISRWIADDPSGRWKRLTDLWDSFLQLLGRRRTLGSWQTPRGIADYQVTQTAEALQSLGYSGLGDDAVTVVDPCCGTGVYLEAVVERSRLEGRMPESMNAPPGGRSRLLGVDISSTAVAASHIRLSATGVRPELYMTDTLAAAMSSSFTSIFESVGNRANQVVGAALDDFDNVRKWASRNAELDPVIAIIGNPPYLRSGLDESRYSPLRLGWFSDLLQQWRRGSGGRGSLQDLFVGFWAWAFDVCRQRHPEIDRRLTNDEVPFDSRRQLYGVVSFITNRNWIDGTTFGPMRSWVSAHAASIQITDFGPGSRGGGASVWSQQPFPIETGTAIVTLVFNPDNSDCNITYNRACWYGGAIQIESTEIVESHHTRGSSEDVLIEDSWVPSASFRSLSKDVPTVSGIRTGADRRWIRTEGDRDFGTRHAYRAFDNRWSPTTPPRSARRGVPVAPDEASPSAFWREDRLFNPHHEFVNEGGWYAILPSSAVKPGPAIHPTLLLPDNHFFKGSEGGKVVRIAPGLHVPPDYSEWATTHQLDGPTFWKYALAAAHHLDYWKDGTKLSQQLVDMRVEPPLASSNGDIAQLIEYGIELIRLWTVDDVDAPEPTGRPGDWHFRDHSQAESITVNGRRVLYEWRRARPGEWDRHRAVEYSHSVFALLNVYKVAQHVQSLMPVS
jgi:hypothetical protein